MGQAYFDPKRESDPYALPDCEVFYLDAAEIAADGMVDEEGDPMEEGWYWWACFPGCLPDSTPFGPFATEAEALADARDWVDFDDEEGGAS